MARLPLTRLVLVFVSLGLASLAVGQEDVYRSALHDYRVVTVVEALESPWSMAFLPDGTMLVTEKPGRLRIVRDGVLAEDPVAGVPEVVYRRQGGLLDVALHPEFASNHLVYLSYSKPVDDEGNAATAVARGRLVDDALVDVEDIFVAHARGAGHFGSRLAFDAAGYLYVTMGDRMVPPAGDLAAHPAQDLGNHHGVTVRLHDDGRVPEDNPFVGREDARPEIYSYGHRNSQGMVIHPDTGDIWQTEHGPQGGDEANVIVAGANYGWPVVGYGVNYRTGLAIHEGTLREGMEPPKHVWVPSIGASGLMLYTGDAFPEWKGDLFAGGLSERQIARLDLAADGRTIGVEETLVYDLGRIRDVRQGPDGFIYVAIDPEEDEMTPIVRLEPVERR